MQKGERSIFGNNDGAVNSRFGKDILKFEFDIFVCHFSFPFFTRAQSISTLIPSPGGVNQVPKPNRRQLIVHTLQFESFFLRPAAKIIHSRSTIIKKECTRQIRQGIGDLINGTFKACTYFFNGNVVSALLKTIGHTRNIDFGRFGCNEIKVGAVARGVGFTQGVHFGWMRKNGLLRKAQPPFNVFALKKVR